jgi:hypothetical protein
MPAAVRGALLYFALRGLTCRARGDGVEIKEVAIGPLMAGFRLFLSD